MNAAGPPQSPNPVPGGSAAATPQAWGPRSRARTANAADAALLVVDDNEDNRYTLTRRLEREGYANLTTANNGRQALELLERQHFDLVLLDIMMPELDGYQVLERLKADVALRDIPVIMISALEEVDSVIRCVELGAEDYLSKPFNPTLLRARVGASLEKKRLRDEVRANLIRVERELESARALQLGMLPGTFPEPSPEQPVRVYALMDPAREVGGDLYDAFYAQGGMFCFLVGDVSGKGAAAGMFMARTRSLVRMAVIELGSRLSKEEWLPAHIAGAVNRELCQNNRERMFVTLFLGFLDANSGTLTYINAGHPLPYLLRGTGVLEKIDGKPEPPLAVRAAIRYQNRTVTLQPGDGLFVFTDGVVEAMNAEGEAYSTERLETQLRAAIDASPESVATTIKASVDTFASGAPKADDVTILALRRHATQG
jgi:phosphoserine phosphatase RsbU/P